MARDLRQLHRDYGYLEGKADFVRSQLELKARLIEEYDAQVSAGELRTLAQQLAKGLGGAPAESIRKETME